MFFAIGKAALKRALKMARNSPGSAVAIGGSTFVVAETIGESTPGYRFFAAETQREAAAKWQRKNEAIIEAGRALIRTLSPEGFLRQRYSEHSVGRQQMKAFLRDWIEAGWPHFSGEVVSAMGVRVYDAIMAEVERANTAAVWLKAPETAPIESDDAPEYDVEQARVALWNKAMGMEPPAMAEFPKVEIGPVKRLPPDAARTSDWQLAAEVIRIADRFIDTVKKFATGEISYTMGMIGEAAAQAGLAIEAACNGDPPQANVDVASYAKSLTSDLLDARKSVKQFGVILDEIRAMVCPHEGMYRSVPRYVRELKEENDRLHAAADSAMAGVLASKATFDAESATLDDGVGMWGWKESARIMPTDSRNIWIWVCRPGATESRLMRASDFHGIEPKMRVEYWRHAETPTPPKR